MKNQLSSILLRRSPRTWPQLLAAVWAAVAASCLPTLAQSATNLPPVRVSYQGFLTDGTGVPLATNTPANYSVDFRIYNSANAAIPLWSERQVVTVDKGNFSVILGEGAPINGENNNNPNLAGIIANRNDASDRYIGLTVTIGNTPNVIQPRLRLLTTPYAFLATSARALTDSTGSNRVFWAANNSRTEINGDVSVSGIIRGDGSGLLNISTASIGSIDASKIGSGVLDANRLGTVPAAKITGVLGLALIPTLDAAHIPGLDGSIITSGTLGSDRVPTTLTGSRAFTGGNLGIGTTTPLAPLHIESADTQGTTLRLGNTSAAGKQWALESTGSSAAGGAGQLKINNSTDGKTLVNITTNQVTITTNLNVQGSLTVGSSQSPLIANGGTENLRIIRGTITVPGTIQGGNGFTVSGAAGGFTVTFSTAFPAGKIPTVTAGILDGSGFIETKVTERDIRFKTLTRELAVLPSGIHFIAIGPR